MPEKTKVLFDMECDNLYEGVTKIWCISTGEVNKDGRFHYGPDSIHSALAYFDTVDCLIGHNIIGYDLAVLKKVVGWVPKSSVQIIDTYVLSRLLNPERKAHSLKYWGEILGFPKVEHDEWDRYSEEMRVRCNIDVELNLLVYNQLLKEIAKGG